VGGEEEESEPAGMGWCRGHGSVRSCCAQPAQPGGIVTWLSQGSVAWGGQGGLSISWLFFVPTVFLLTAAVFACIGQLIGRELERFAPLRGYALNLLGSLLGVLAFSLLSYLSTPPLLWFGLTFAGMFPFLVGGEPP
jgi:hypothetical protein